MTDELPPLPAPALPAGYYRHHTSPGGNYTADQMREYAAAAVAREREQCLAEIESGIWIDKTTEEVLDSIAAAIRAR